jgi:hypothetical protein
VQLISLPPLEAQSCAAEQVANRKRVTCQRRLGEVLSARQRRLHRSGIYAAAVRCNRRQFCAPL